MQYSNHGANPTKVFHQYGIIPPRRIIDFSTNTNVIHKRLFIPVSKISREYPDYAHIKVKLAISKNILIPTENIMVTNGINEILYILSTIYNEKKIGLLRDEYTEYKRAFQFNNVTFFNELKDVKGIDVFICSNPNNPQGNFVNKEYLEELSQSMLVVIDESYIEFVEDKKPTVTKNILRLRSLTKIYHLSGLRIGYIVGEKELIDLYSSYQATWSVNGVAQYAAIKYLEDQRFMTKTRDFYRKEVPYVKRELSKLGIEYLKSHANFLLLKISSKEIPFFLKRGLVVRHTFSYPNLNGEYIRISVKKRHHNKLLLKALKEYKNENLSN